MKKVIAILLLAVMVLTLAACKTNKLTEKDIIGKWTVIGVYNSDDQSVTSSPLYTTAIEFKEDNTFKWRRITGQEVSSGTFELKDKLLYFNDDMFLLTKTDDNTITIKGSDLTLKLSRVGG